MAEILLGLLRASREGNWELHVSTVRKMIPWCFAYDKVNYARYLSSYLSEMSHLEKGMPSCWLNSGLAASQYRSGAGIHSVKYQKMKPVKRL